MDALRDWWGVVAGMIGAAIGVGVAHGANQAKQADIERRLSNVENRVDGLGEKIDDIREDVASMKADVSWIKARMEK